MTPFQKGINILSIESGSYVSGTELIIAGIASELTGLAPEAIDKIQVSTNGGGSWNDALGTESWVYTWTLPVENGVAHTIIARVVDAGGGTHTSDSVEVIVDTVAPEVSAVLPLPDAGGVLVDTAILVTFSESVDPASLRWQSVPDPGGWDFNWSNDHTMVTAKHAGFQNSTTYAITLEARDWAGSGLIQPFNWQFSTEDEQLHLNFFPIMFK